MNTFEAIQARRNVRAYADRPIPAKELDQILEAARRTPSSMNEQRWDFVVVTDRQELQELSRVWDYAGHVASSAATIALVAMDASDPAGRESIQYDLGQATMSILLAATDLGIGSGHAAVSDQLLAREILGFPAGYFCAWLIALGYPKDRPLKPMQKPKRRPFNEVVHRGRW
ncbi:MAG: nitroreductase family protein [Candidatus Dormibacteraeota bacterium]|nr:nitroreductase family protein [Candidatus Dormibacteraeota bacterium]MDQ6899762.1 nitroreductase family protein [Candidatus Dormibacteraeota bacterium]